MDARPQSSLRVLVVSSRPIVRAGLAALLRPFRPLVMVVGEVDDVDAGLAESARSEPDVILYDTSLGRTGGLDEVTRLARAAYPSRIVVVARRQEARFTWLTLQRGAAGFLLETVTGADLVAVLEEVGGGAASVDPTLAGGHHPGPADPAPPWPGAHLGLTETESQVLELIAHGEVAAEVERRLGLSGAELKTIIRSAYRRLHAQDRSDALARLAREGLFVGERD